MIAGAFADLCRSLLQEGKPIRFRATGASMNPAIRDGDLLTVEHLDAHSIADGQVAVYIAAGRLRAHRVRGRHEEGHLICQGDNAFCRKELVPERSVLGIVTGVGLGCRPVPRRGLGVARMSFLKRCLGVVMSWSWFRQEKRIVT